MRRGRGSQGWSAGEVSSRTGGRSRSVPGHCCHWGQAGMAVGHQQGISLPTLLWSLHSLQQDTSTGTGISTTPPGWLGADQLKCSEPPQKQIWKEVRTCKKPKHLTACIKDQHSVEPQWPLSLPQPSGCSFQLDIGSTFQAGSTCSSERTMSWTTKSWNNQGLEREMPKEDQRHF